MPMQPVMPTSTGTTGVSPVMMINEDTYGSLTPAKAKDIVRKIREASK